MSNNKYEKYTTFDSPIPYKSLLIYPATMRDYFEFMASSPVLLMDIYSVPDPKILSMKYLEYLFHIKEYDEETKKDYYPYLNPLYFLLKLVLRIEDGDEDNKIEFFQPDGMPTIRIGKDVFDKNDFEVIREIIIEQNLLNPPNHKIDKKLRDSMAEARTLKAKMGESKTCSIEDQMTALMTETSLRMEDIYNMTIRRFSKALERVDNTLHYKVYLSASMSGMVTFKDKSFIKHWLVDLQRDELDELVAYNSIENTVTKGNL